MKKFLIVQMASFGDCLYATTIAKQIKHNFPDSHVTWAISTKFSSILFLNPHVDKIWEVTIPQGSNYYDKPVWDKFIKEANAKKQKGEFDEIIISQIPQINWGRFDGSIRSTTLKGYAHPITVSVKPVIVLSDKEINNVKSFAEKHQLNSFKEVVLFECAPGSGQSLVNVTFAYEIAKRMSEQHANFCFILSSPDKIIHTNKNIIDASELSFRENAELTKYCTLLIGCSSGITWLSTSDWAKPLPTIQLLNRNSGIYAGLNFDFEIQKINNTSVIELLDYDHNIVMSCLNLYFTLGYEAARLKYNQEYKPTILHLEMVAGFMLANKNSFYSIIQFAQNFIKTNQNLGNPIPFNLTSFALKMLISKFKARLRY